MVPFAPRPTISLRERAAYAGGTGGAGVVDHRDGGDAVSGIWRATCVAALLCGMATPGVAQTRKVTLTWTDTVNPAATTYTVKRAAGLCTGTPTFATLATGIATKTYEDTTVSIGNYCYVVTATLAGLESAPSNAAGAAVLPRPPLVSEVRVE